MSNIKALFSEKPTGRLLKVSLAIVVIAFSFILVRSFRTFAQDTQNVTTTVTIGNAAPAFTAGPSESPATSTTDPISSGGVVTFSATASDSNGQDYYLTVCNSAGITAHANSAGTCTGTEYCHSNVTISGTATSCTYTTSGSDSYSNPWFAYVCDGDTGAASCSSAGQGTGDSGSPLFVNHAPTFSTITNDSPANPGETVTWNATASDPDYALATPENTVKLLVCKSANMSAGVCTDGSWCESSAVASNPSCTYTVPSVAEDGTNTAYVFVVDQHDTPAAGAAQGTESNFTVSNVAPTVTNVYINDGDPITLTESTTTSVPVTATVTDKNGCSTSEITTVHAYAYRSGATCTSTANSNGNNCYAQISCTQDVGTCDTLEGSVDYTCSVPIQYYADPTVADTPFASENWIGRVSATDDDTTSGSASSTGVEMNALIAFDVTTEINYGSLGIGEILDATALPQQLITTPTGNVGLDQSHLGTQMCTNYPTCTGGTPIPVGQQHYGLTAVAYSSGTPLTTTAAEVELNVPKVNNGTVTTKTTFWGIQIPSGTLAGTYTGQNTITAVLGEIANW